MLKEKLLSLKLYGMAKSVEEELYSDLTFEDRLNLLLDKEIASRQDKQLRILLLKAKLKYGNACIEETDFKAQRGLSKSQLIELSSNDWIKKSRNIIITGATGAGKTYLACALGNSACRGGVPSLYIRLPRLLQEMKISRADGSYIKLLNKLSKIRLLIIDDWGINLLDEMQRRDLLEIFEDRHQLRSTIITAQVPVDKWHEVIGEPTIADAILDRIVHNAYQIKLAGESMRKKMATDKS
ncbi:MAG: IS21-like element helper ATPase IstB [bacterium]